MARITRNIWYIYGVGMVRNGRHCAYSAAKAAIYGFTRTLAIEGSRYGIHVNAIAPGALTRMTGDVLGDDGDIADITGLTGEDLMMQLGPQQVAPAVVYLAHESCLLNGETLSASGGRVGRAFMGVTKGIYEEDLTLESVAERIDEICDEDDYVVPDNVDQEMQLLLEHFNTDDT